MARPVDADSAATYDRIVDTALRHVRELGAGKVSVRRVASEADVSVGTIAYYFENREGLLEACMEHGYGWIREQVELSLGRIIGGEPLGDEVEDFARRLFRRAREDREIILMRRLITIQRGALPRHRLENELLPVLDKVGAALGGAGGFVGRIRLASHTLESMVGAYGHPHGRRVSPHHGRATLPAAERAMEDHLAEVARALFTSALGG